MHNTIAPTGKFKISLIHSLLLSSFASLLSGCGGSGGDAGNTANVERGGQVDVSFATSGKAVISRNPIASSDIPHAMAIDGNGDIVIAGGSRVDVPASDTFVTPGYAPFVLKLDSSGRPVAGFGTNGKVKPAGDRFFSTMALSNGPSNVSLALGESGSVFVAQCGASGIDRNQLVVFKLDASGKPVAGFGNAGSISADICNASSGKTQLLRDSAGNLYLIGTSPSRELQSTPEVTRKTNSIVIAKFDSSGKPAAGFGTAGNLSFSFSPNNLDDVYAARIDHQGNLYVFGKSLPPSDAASGSGQVFVVTKFDGNGKPDTGFGAGGLAFLPFGDASVPATMAGIDDGVLAFAGVSGSVATGYGITAIKLDANGKPLSGFGDSGKKRIELGANGLNSLSSLAMDGNGNLYAAGSNGSAARQIPDANGNICSTDFAAVKIDARGALATGFGNGGQVAVDFGTGNEAATAVALDQAGRVVLAGGTYLACSDTRPYSPDFSSTAVTRLIP